MPRSAVRLPPGVRSPFQVYVNGVRQSAGTDFEVRDGTLLFDRELVQEGKLGFWRWTIGAFGIGTYKRNDSVDVSYTLPGGQPMVAEGLPVQSRD